MRVEASEHPAPKDCNLDVQPHAGAAALRHFRLNGARHANPFYCCFPKRQDRVHPRLNHRAGVMLAWLHPLQMAAMPKPAPSASIGAASRMVPPADPRRSSAPKSPHSAPVVCGATLKPAICPDTERGSTPSCSLSSSPPTPANPSSPSPTSLSSAALLSPSRIGG